MGHHNHDFSGDKYALTGVWGPPTSWANFCEEDYAVTQYAAEFVNTLSNIAYVYLALCYPGRRHGHHTGGVLFTRLDAMSMSLVLVGVTSTAFHGTMLLHAQLCDELSMLVLATAMLHRLYTVGRAPFVQRTTAVFLVTVTTGLAVAYVRSGNVMYHVTIFGAQLTCIWPRTLYLIFSSSCKGEGAGAGAERTRAKQQHMVRRFFKAILALAVGYGLWHVDLEFCEPLRSWRRAVGAPWSALLEFHGWWHVLTALGAIEYIKLVRELCP
ncbi:alkaline ceramidase family protein [Apiospora saccharicola]|uniref:Alkaline ceramidase family protein n=1 Tax=Apiospora saccharicola TaxID=335842 RepID=A0ABR1UJS1_9PEZI